MDAEVKKSTTTGLERSFGSFSRSFSLPTTVDTGKIGADFKHGVLTAWAAVPRGGQAALDQHRRRELGRRLRQPGPRRKARSASHQQRADLSVRPFELRRRAYAAYACLVWARKPVRTR